MRQRDKDKEERGGKKYFFLKRKLKEEKKFGPYNKLEGGQTPHPYGRGTPVL